MLAALRLSPRCPTLVVSNKTATEGSVENRSTTSARCACDNEPSIRRYFVPLNHVRSRADSVTSKAALGHTADSGIWVQAARSTWSRGSKGESAGRNLRFRISHAQIKSFNLHLPIRDGRKLPTARHVVSTMSSRQKLLCFTISTFVHCTHTGKLML